ncbi:MAG: hypothetical protein ABSH46_17795 [Bryobacteraceae bacterium]|jgi:hypothetical protein
MENHVKILAILHIVFGALGLLAALLCLAFFGVIAGVIQTAAESSSNPDAQLAVPVVGIVGAIIVILVVVFSLPGIVTGFGLLHHREWARILGIVLAAISLPGVPFGTALGIYGLWVLLNAETARLFARPRPQSGVMDPR